MEPEEESIDTVDLSTGTPNQVIEEEPVAQPNSSRPTLKELRKKLRQDVRKQAHSKFNEMRWFHYLELPSLVVIPMVLSFFLAYYEYSWISLTILCFGFLMILKRRVDLFTRLYRLQIERDAKREQLNTHIESAEWINHIVMRIWGVFEPTLSSMVQEQVNEQLEQLCPPFLSAVKLTSFSLGSEAPAIVGAKTYPDTNKDVIHLDIDVMFVPRTSDTVVTPLRRTKLLEYPSKIVMAARVGKGRIGVDIPVLIEGLSVEAKARLELKLMPGIPVIQIASLCLREKPKVDFILKPLKSLDIMDLPGLSHWLSFTIDSVVSSILVAPNRIKVDVKTIYEQLKAEKNKPKGLLKVIIYGAKIPKTSEYMGTVDPYMKIELVTQTPTTMGRTKELTDNQNPEWNQVFYILCSDPLNSSVELQLYHLNTLSKDKQLGLIEIKLGEWLKQMERIQPGFTSHLERSISEPYKNKETGVSRGEIHYGWEYYPALTEIQVAQKMAEESKETTAISYLDIVETFTAGIARISLQSLQDVLPKGTIVPRPMNVYIEVFMFSNIDDAPKTLTQPIIAPIYKTKVKKGTNSPYWSNASFDVLVRDLNNNVLYVQVREESELMGSGSIIADCILSTYDLILKLEEGNEQLYPLRSAAGQLVLNVSFYPLDVDLTEISEVLKPVFLPTSGLFRCLCLEGKNMRRIAAIKGINVVGAVVGTVGEATNYIPGKSKPKIYIKVSLSGNLLLKTKPHSDDLNPIWVEDCQSVHLSQANGNATFPNLCFDSLETQDIKFRHLKEKLYIELMEVSTFTQDTCLGTAEIPIVDIEKNRDAYLDIWLPIKRISKTDSVELVSTQEGQEDVIGELRFSLFINPVKTHEETEELDTIAEDTLGFFRMSILGLSSFLPDVKDCQVQVEFKTSQNQVDYKTFSRSLSEDKESLATLWEESFEIFMKYNECQINVHLLQPQEGKSTNIIASTKTNLYDLLNTNEISFDQTTLLVKTEFAPLSEPPLSFKHTPQLLYITVEAASKLMPVDSSGTSDPFVILRYNGIKLEKTKTIKKNLNPIWNESFTFPIPLDLYHSLLTFEVMDWNMIDSSFPLGSYSYRLYEDSHRHVVLKASEENGEDTDDKKLRMKILDPQGALSFQRTFQLENASTGSISIRAALKQCDTEASFKHYQELWNMYKPSKNLVSTGAGAAGAMVTGTASAAGAVVSGTATAAGAVFSGTATAAGAVVGGAGNIASMPFKGGAALAKKGKHMFSNESKPEKEDEHSSLSSSMLKKSHPSRFNIFK